MLAELMLSHGLYCDVVSCVVSRCPRAAEKAESSRSWPDQGLSSPIGRVGYFAHMGNIRAVNGSQKLCVVSRYSCGGS